MRLHIAEHCIETAIKRRYRRIQSLFLELEESDQRFHEYAQSLQQIETFLRHTDFRKLRAERPELAGGFDLEVELVQGDHPSEFEIVIVRSNK